VGDHRYLIALGSNVRHPHHGAPAAVLRAALAVLRRNAIQVEAASPIIASAPLGPSRRRYANAAAVVSTDLAPQRLLTHLKRLEAQFGRRSRGSRWQARVLDLDIILWSGGTFASNDLAIPHPEFRYRPFVLQPACTIAADWRDPLSSLSIRHLSTRLTKPQPAPRAHPSRTHSRHRGP
jgi:2-amino-4-hydroxy-6-hydroxymethyldihydropteridine diphosphokinase